ncbi:peroxidase 47-like protein [Carex littledalei]|uniref:Peroxidase n=1 Tax=Carex littledalei TaxID=544730 RepID=A0A833RJ23_9POAL|nr:peroxidase 47-like protein [Carex littledalei]
MASKRVVSLFLLLLIGVQMRGSNGLSNFYYGMNCPFVEMIVRNVVNQALQKDPTLAAGLLRLHFHDCFVQGCDASILIDASDGTAEKDSPANGSVRGYEVIDQIKQLIEARCPGTVSCADIVALAARDAVFWAGGPYYGIMTGRRDGTRSKIEDTRGLPPPTLNTTDLIKLFVNQHGFTIPELVALSGGHTIGVARCSSLKNRLDNVDPTLEPNFAQSLTRTCSAGDSTTVPFDRTSTTFDNVYFRALQSSQGVLTSDQTLYNSPQTRMIVDNYAMNQAMFFFNFQQGMLKMGQLDLKEGNQGEVRLNCRKIN